MNEILEKKLSLFVRNTQAIKREFKWQDNLTKRLSALLYAIEDREINAEAIQNCIKMMKEETSAFSTFRGNMAPYIATMLALNPGSRVVFSHTKDVYDMLKKAKFSYSDYLAITAFLIASCGRTGGFERLVGQTKAFHDALKKNHPLLTGTDDYIFSVMLVLAGIEPDTGCARIEELYRQFKPMLHSSTNAQTLAEIMVIGGADDEAASRVQALRDAFRSKKLKMDKTYTAPSLGILAQLPVETDTLVTDIEEAFGYLKKQKGFGVMSTDSEELLLYATEAVVSTYAGETADDKNSATLASGITRMLLARQAQMLIMINITTAAGAAAAAAASGHSG